MTTAPTPATSGTDLRRFVRSFFVYLVPTVLLRGVSVILTPFYTRSLSPADYAVVGVANTIWYGLTVLFGLGLHSALLRLYADARNPDSRRQLVGGTTLALLAGGTTLAFALHIVWSQGWVQVSRLLPYAEGGNLILLASVATLFTTPLTTLYIAQERPTAFGVFSVCSSLLQMTTTVVFVVVLDRGARGAIEAITLSQGAAGLFSLVALARESSLRGAPSWAWRAIRLGLPLLPHGAATWVLALADRLVLERYVEADELGRYTLAYLFGAALSMATGAIAQTLHPMAMRRLSADPSDPLVPRLGTYAIAAVAFIGTLGLAVSVEAVDLLAPTSYAGTVRFVPWMLLGSFFQGVYFVWSLGTWFAKRTIWMSVIATVTSLITIALNLVLVPRFGADAAAMVTAGTYGLSAATHGFIAQKLHRIRWEYRRWSAIGIATALVTVVWWFTLDRSAATRITVLALMVLIVWPASLLSLAGLHDEERRVLSRARQIVKNFGRNTKMSP
jgi:O-antigen/teichoic acid export membrane protein